MTFNSRRPPPRKRVGETPSARDTSAPSPGSIVVDAFRRDGPFPSPRAPVSGLSPSPASQTRDYLTLRNAQGRAAWAGRGSLSQMTRRPRNLWWFRGIVLPLLSGIVLSMTSSHGRSSRALLPGRCQRPFPSKKAAGQARLRQKRPPCARRRRYVLVTSAGLRRRRSRQALIQADPLDAAIIGERERARPERHERGRRNQRGGRRQLDAAVVDGRTLRWA
jgi:hypothetical protein